MGKIDIRELPILPILHRRGFITLALASVCLAGCVTESREAPGKSYAGEPYPVRLVNRDKFDARFQPVTLSNETGQPPGTIIVDTSEKLLTYVESPTRVRRYGVAVGKAGYAWKGVAAVGRKSTWPAWYPTDDMRADAPGIPRRIPPGDDNPLGARALYLYRDGRDTLYRIHGTSEPWAIGSEASSGCIRMLNEDVIDLYEHVAVGTKVIVR